MRILERLVSGYQAQRASQAIQWLLHLWTMQNLSLLNLSLKRSRITRTSQEKESMGRLMAKKSILVTKGLLLELGVHQVHIKINT